MYNTVNEAIAPHEVLCKFFDFASTYNRHKNYLTDDMKVKIRQAVMMQVFADVTEGA